MNLLCSGNLQTFCRLCLNRLRPIEESMVMPSASTQNSYNIHQIPHLTNIMVLLMSLDIVEDSHKYPQNICEMCYDKLQKFLDFRKLALHSAKILLDIVNNDTGEQYTREVEKVLIKQEKLTDNEEHYSDGNTDNNALLLPSPTHFQPKHVEDSFQISSTQIKVERDLDIEFDGGTNDADSTDDADDEEYWLPYGADNNLSIKSEGQPNKRSRGKKSLHCPRCSKTFYKQVHLDAHIRGVHEGIEKPFFCLECGRAYKRYNQLHDHIELEHQREENNKCPFQDCSFTYRKPKTLTSHIYAMHTADASTLSPDLQQFLSLHKVQLNAGVDLTCQQCSKSYSTRNALVQHLKRHTQFKKHVCPFCGVAKVTRTELQTHLRTHESLEKFKCHICSQEFNHKNAISRHVRVVHEGQRNFQCSFCSRRFGTRNAKESHERLHTGERPFACEFCNRSFAQQESLRSHRQSHDVNLRKHICSFCSKRFITRKNLLDHEKRHNSDKPHICDLCSRGFSRYEDLIIHAKIHRLEEKDRKTNLREAKAKTNEKHTPDEMDCQTSMAEAVTKTGEVRSLEETSLKMNIDEASAMMLYIDDPKDNGSDMNVDDGNSKIN